MPAIRQYFHWQPLGEAIGSQFLGYMSHLALAMGMTVAVAVLSWHALEKHFLALKRYFDYKPKFSPATPPDTSLGAPLPALAHLRSSDPSIEEQQEAHIVAKS